MPHGDRTVTRCPRRLRYAAGFAATLFVTPGTAQADDLTLAEGRYELASQMQMPHLEEMRRMVTRETRCIAPNDVRALFPVMRQPALRGCEFGYATRHDARTRLVLVCASARVATGTAELRPAARGLIGHLQIKMGGKNMTFSQRVEATRVGDCDGDSPAP